MREYVRRYRERNHERLRARQRELYWQNPEKYRKKSRDVRAARSPEHAKKLRRIQYVKHNEGVKYKESNSAYQKIWRKQNKEHSLAYQRQYAEENREKIRLRNRNYVKNNSERIKGLRRTSKHARRAREAAASGRWTAKDIAQLNKRQKGRCYWCKMKYGKHFHIDHVWPLVRGGSNGAENIVLSCPTCNVRKNAKTPIEFAGRLL